MPLILSFTSHTLRFKFEAGTSRGVLTSKKTYLLTVRSSEYPEVYGVGEAGPLKGLSIDDVPNFEKELFDVSKRFNSKQLPADGWSAASLVDELVPKGFPSIRFGLEAALIDYQNGGKRMYFENDFSRGKQTIPINGLIWMGTPEFMERQIEEKLADGYQTLKMKVGAVDFDQECRLLASVRSRYSKEQITLRVDANGAFSPAEAPKKLARLSTYDLHSIEQPIRQGQADRMAELVKCGVLDIALDEELIGSYSSEDKARLLETIRPPYIILKPTLLGGFSETMQWISLAEELGIRWWITSALESNVGLTAIAQFTGEFENLLPQGLGTGQLYHNNFGSGLSIKNGRLSFNREASRF